MSNTPDAKIATLEADLAREAKLCDQCIVVVTKLMMILGNDRWRDRVHLGAPAPYSGNLYTDILVLANEVMRDNRECHQMRERLEAVVKQWLEREPSEGAD